MDAHGLNGVEIRVIRAIRVPSQNITLKAYPKKNHREHRELRDSF
jgi:hypothetical protein